MSSIYHSLFSAVLYANRLSTDQLCSYVIQSDYSNAAYIIKTYYQEQSMDIIKDDMLS